MENAAQMDTIRHYLANSPEIDSITVYAYASPEGPFHNNAKLAKKRGEAAKKFILETAQRDIVVNIIPVAEDWEGLHMEILNNYHLEDRQEILDILENESFSNDRKEIEIKKHRESYQYILENLIPQLRRAEWTCYWIVPKPKIERCRPIEAPLLKASDNGLAVTSAEETPAVPAEETLAETAPAIPTAPTAPAEPAPTKKTYTPALKTNLLYDIATVLNASTEFPIGKNFSIMIEDTFPWWNWGPNGNKYCLQLWEMGIEPRWWFKKEAKFQGHFVGLYAKSAMYDFQYDTKINYQGEYWSTGATYGYAMMLGRHLRLEFSLSVGFLQTDYRHYQPSHGYEDLYIDKYKTGTVSYFGPTKVAVSLVLPIDIPYKKK